MSVQFGIWNFDGKAPRSENIGKAVSVLIPYGPDGQGSFSGSGVFIVYRAFHTTEEARRETQPFLSESGTVITWDGRLDNRAELRQQQLRPPQGSDCPDILLVAAAYEQWGTECFAKLLGDWAVSIWIPNEQSLILAKDAIGTRQLYYSFRNAQLTWSTLLEPLVWNSDQPLKLNEEYIAGWLGFFPAAELTPYAGIHAVPPCSFVRVKGGTLRVCKYWDFNSDRQIIYRNDAEYEEHFRNAFGAAVKCRLRSDRPLLAELSGGIDSSAIVCMADTLLRHEKAETTRLETISYFDDSEPNWNERPFFEKVEEKRGRVGYHIDVGAKKETRCDFSSLTFCVTPASGEPAGREFVACMSSVGSRVVLSGIGGDEVTGGVPTPIPELADFLARARFVRLSHQLKAWALNKRTPWFHLLFEVAQRFFPSGLVGIPEFKRPAPWLDLDFVNRNSIALQGYETRLSLFGALPTFQENLSALCGLRRQLACDPLPCAPPYEKRYPYLDRSLLEFLYAIPREQLLRPGQRRSLMRRALVGIVPEEILSRKRKAYVSRAPLATISEEWAHLDQMGQKMVSSALGIVDQQRFRETLNNARRGQEVALVTLMRTIAIETWLRSHRDGGLLDLMADNPGFAVATSSTERTSDAVRGVRELFSSGEH